EGNRRQTIAHLARLVAASGNVANPKLSLSVGAPALDGAVVEQRARVISSGGDRNRGAPRSQGDRREAVAHLARIIAAADLVAQPERPGSVVAPALDGAVVQEGAREIPAYRDSASRSPRPEGNRREVVPHFA